MTRWLPVIVALGLAASGAARAECDHCPKDRAEQAGGMQAAGRTPTADGTQASGGTMEPGAAHTPGTAGSLRSAGTPYEEPDAVVGADRAHGSHGSYGAHDAEDSGDSRGWSSDDGAERYGLDYGYWREGKTHVSHDPAHIWYRGPAPRAAAFGGEDRAWDQRSVRSSDRSWDGRGRAAAYAHGTRAHGTHAHGTPARYDGRWSAAGNGAGDHAGSYPGQPASARRMSAGGAGAGAHQHSLGDAADPARDHGWTGTNPYRQSQAGSDLRGWSGDDRAGRDVYDPDGDGIPGRSFRDRAGFGSSSGGYGDARAYDPDGDGIPRRPFRDWRPGEPYYGSRWDGSRGWSRSDGYGGWSGSDEYRGWSGGNDSQRYGLDYGYWREGELHVSHDPAHIWYRGPAPRQTLFASDDDNGRWADSGKNRRWEGRSRAAGFCPHCGRRLPGGAAYGMGWGPHHYGQDYYGGPPARPGRRGYGPAWRDQREDRTWRGDWHGGKRMDPSYRKGPSTGH